MTKVAKKTTVKLPRWGIYAKAKRPPAEAASSRLWHFSVMFAAELDGQRLRRGETV